MGVVNREEGGRRMASHLARGLEMASGDSSEQGRKYTTCCTYFFFLSFSYEGVRRDHDDTPCVKQIVLSVLYVVCRGCSN